MPKALPDFHAPDLARVVERMVPEAVDALPFGAIRLDRDGHVVFYSRAERELSGIGTRPTLGRNFFLDIAPCMDNPAFRGRIESARAAGTLDIAFSHVGDFSDRSRELDVRVQSAADQGIWIFLQRV
jgi:photoactive yellow protein